MAAPRSPLLALLLVALLGSGCVLTVGQALRERGPTPPEPPTSETDRVLAAALRRSAERDQGARGWGALGDSAGIIVLRDSPFISARILPSDIGVAFFLLDLPEIQHLLDWHGPVTFLRVSPTIVGKYRAVVRREVRHVGGGGGISCDDSEFEEYVKRHDSWTFVESGNPSVLAAFADRPD